MTGAFPRLLATLCGLSLLAYAGSLHAQADGVNYHGLVFDTDTEWASTPELVRRLMSPLAAARLAREAAQAKRPMAGRLIELSAERFTMHVPPQQPAGGYALLVFVPPWQDARLPDGWGRVFDEFGVIFVSAERSGNDEIALGRRAPLALLAAHNVMRRYSINSEHVYVGGFSGGSRVALRLALGYPEIFRGAFLDAGSDPIGNPDAPLPPRELFQRFRRTSHLVFVTGERDQPHAYDQLRSVRSLHRWCVSNVDDFIQPRLDHEVARPEALRRALRVLLKCVAPAGAAADACERALDSELASALHDAETLIASGRRRVADDRLNAIDERFGGLPGPRTVEVLAPCGRLRAAAAARTAPARS